MTLLHKTDGTIINMHFTNDQLCEYYIVIFIVQRPQNHLSQNNTMLLGLFRLSDLCVFVVLTFLGPPPSDISVAPVHGRCFGS